jgi:hypothetical protein
MIILFLIGFEISLKMISQIFFSGSLVLYEVGLVPNVYCEKGVNIGQGLNMLFNPLFNVPLNEPQ